MAPVAPAAEQASNLLQKLSLDPQQKFKGAVEATKQVSSVQNGSSNTDASNMPITSEHSLTPVLSEFVDSGNYYVPAGYVHPAYFYGGYDHAINDWKDYPRYVYQDVGQGLYGDLHRGYGYARYNAYPSNGSAALTTGHDGQLYGKRRHQYQVPIFESHTPTSSTDQGEASTACSADQTSISLDAPKNPSGVTNGNTNNGRSSHQNLSNASRCNGGYQDLCYRFDGMWSSVAWYANGHPRPATARPLPTSTGHNTNNWSARNQYQQPIARGMEMNAHRSASGIFPSAPLVSRMYQTNRIYGSRNKFGYGQGRILMDKKHDARNQRNVFSDASQRGFNELNRGPRASHYNNQKPGQSTMVKFGKSQTRVPLDTEQYNRQDFSDKYSSAKFFIIKSYSEDDVHKSIKYNVWASTLNGNKKLNAGYQQAQEGAGDCPVFLFFSVNASGQFVGVAEMVGPVNFNKTVDYWQHDKWIGCFPLKWHIIKDVPNSIMKHITLENNENKPVTNSRDTQEVKLEQGLQMLKIFKEHTNNTCILDDFEFYEDCQNSLLDKRANQHFQKQVWDVKTSHPPSKGAREVDNVLGL
ncbi:YTH domain-containing protein ECT2-like [Zingiber officinale]|uniref:YTH domain-containing protein ECT2-like n=1 Tax=Zingiber officinale TaxID=94328 RepID=UPI001C4DB402|nr:YTH domain-containing protein ECT2-like [Zingiber officinale]